MKQYRTQKASVKKKTEKAAIRPACSAAAKKSRGRKFATSFTETCKKYSGMCIRLRNKNQLHLCFRPCTQRRAKDIFGSPEPNKLSRRRFLTQHTHTRVHTFHQHTQHVIILKIASTAAANMSLSSGLRKLISKSRPRVFAVD